ncbi:MAG: M23 family metallopeptidase [Bacteroidales bacterium]|nr:M23 family metallopeptidase [Bacteroidales bacterium]
MMRILLIYLFLAVSCGLSAQKAIPTDYFSSPLGIDLSVTGTFGEIRPNHFHSGIDFQVQKKEGLPVYAVADGWVSRIKISPVGFGNALYIDHPNGYTSVYGHLFDYNDTIRKYAHLKQYLLKSFEVDLFPATKKDSIFVSKGQLIGYAGNSGSSFGAHLHFELRNTKTERVINPLLFGLSCKDLYPPYIDLITLSPVNEQSTIEGSLLSTKFNVKKNEPGEYRLAAGDTLKAWGLLELGIEAYDFLYSKTDRNGWYSMTVFMDKGTLFSMQVDSFAFTESRYVNASIDYSRNYKNGNRLLKTRKLPGNELLMHSVSEKNGVLILTDSLVHEIVVVVTDFEGHKTVLRWWIQSSMPQQMVQVPELIQADTIVKFTISKTNEFITPEIKVLLPKGSLYDQCQFEYRKSAARKGYFSELHSLHNPEIPLHKKMKISIKADKLPVRLRSKALLARIDREGGRHPAGGSYENGYVSTDSYFFDSYAIVVDSIPPSLKIIHDKSKSRNTLKFRVSDNFSGIRDYKGEINDEWALVEWDPKNKLMIYRFDEKVQTGKNNFRLEVWDEKGNKASASTSFIGK